MRLVEQTGGDASELVNPILVHSLQILPSNRFDSQRLFALLHQRYLLVNAHRDTWTNKIKIFVKTLSGKTISLRVNPFDTIKSVMELYYKKEGHSICDQQLLYRTRKLDPERTVEDYDIRDGHLLHMVLPFSAGIGQVPLTLSWHQEYQIDKLLEALNRRETVSVSEKQDCLTEIEIILDSLSFYTWNERQARKIIRLKELQGKLTRELASV